MSWRIVEHSWEDTSILDGDATICRLSIHDLGVEVTEENQSELETIVRKRADILAAAPVMLAALKMTSLDLHPQNPNDGNRECICSQCEFRRAAAAAIEQSEGRGKAS